MFLVAPSTGVLPLRRRPDVIVGNPDADGFRVVKDPQNSGYYRMGPQESFLLEQLDGTRDANAVCSAFEQRFGEALTPEELDEFVAMARDNGLLQPCAPQAGPHAPVAPPESPPLPAAPPSAPVAATDSGQSILRLRLKLCNPDRLFTDICPLVAFFWTWPFAVASLVLAASAGCVLWGNKDALIDSFQHALTWHTLLLVWVVVLATLTLHEFAHGLTCKHFGGEVREIGLLLIFFMPGMYADVSDAWLFGARWKRVLVTLAGPWWDLIVWSLAVFGWRMTQPGTLVNHILFVTAGTLFTRIVLNLNPLIRLDGYYLLCDVVNVPNLQKRAVEYLTAVLRWLLLGGPRPAPEKAPALLLIYGLLSTVFMAVTLGLMVGVLTQMLGERLGAVGAMSVLVLALLLLRGFIAGLDGGELERMLQRRYVRTLVWSGVLGAGIGYLLLGSWEDRAAGVFQLKSLARGQVRAPVAGFLDEVLVYEGQRVERGEVLARLRVPNLDTRMEQNRAESREAQARLALLEAGTRPEQLEELRSRVERAEQALSRAGQDLTRARRALVEELASLASQVDAAKADCANAQQRLARGRRMLAGGALAEETYHDLRSRCQVASASVARSDALLRNRRTIGTRDAELEVERCRRELGEARAAQRLAEVGSRQEEIDAEKARLARVREEGRYLKHIESQLVVVASHPGTVTTPDLPDRLGHYLREGDLICAVEQPGVLEAEVLLSDQEVSRVAEGQRVELRPRDHPRLSVYATVVRVAPRAWRPGATRDTGAGDPTAATSAVTAYCRVEDTPEDLRPGALGHARIYRGRRPIRDILYDRVLQLLRTEFWW